MNTKKWILVSAMFLIIVLSFMSACTQQNNNEQNDQGEVNNDPDELNLEEDEKENEQQDENESPEDKADEHEYPYYAPLTGLGLDEQLNQQPIAVLINNQTQARPQTGLGAADVVYELLTEGFITRFFAIYHSQIPEVIGPVRSLREYYVDLGQGYDAVFAHAGGSDLALDALRDRGLPSLNALIGTGSPSFYRVNFRQAPHNLYTGREGLLSGLERRGYGQNFTVPERVFKAAGEVMDGVAATSIQINYHSTNRVSYEYDADAEQYVRYTQGVLQEDRDSGVPHAMTNILVVETPHGNLGHVERGHFSLDGPGRGYLFQKGKMQEVSWEKVDGIIRPFRDGEEVGLYPGKTWINVIPTQGGGLESIVQYSE